MGPYGARLTDHTDVAKPVSHLQGPVLFPLVNLRNQYGIFTTPKILRAQEHLYVTCDLRIKVLNSVLLRLDLTYG